MSYLHAPAYRSALGAVRASLEDLPSTEHTEDERAEGVLQEVYGLSLLDDTGVAGREKEEINADLESCVRAAGVDVATVMDLMDLLGEISLWPGDDDDDFEGYDEPHPKVDKSVPPPGLHDSKQLPLSANPDRLLTRPTTAMPEKTERVIPGSRAAPTSAANPTAHDSFGLPSTVPPQHKAPKIDRQIHPLNWRTVNHARVRPTRALHPHAAHIPTYARGVLPQDPTPGSLFRPPASSDLSIDECLARAAAERAVRGEAVRAAGKHFQGNKAVNGAVAGHYALQARQAAERVREWEMRAARMVVHGQLEQTGHTIDLHHLTIQEASALSIEAVERWWARQKVKGYDGIVAGSNQKPLTFAPGRPLTIVTGVGRHSAGKRGVLGPAVANVLEGAGWRVDRGSTGQGYLVVRGRR